MKFEDLRLAEPLLRALAAEGYATPTPIQAKAIPHVMEGKDILGCAQTGTGKTAAFALPILHRLSQKQPAASASTHATAHSHGHHRPQAATRATRALILSPTRELAAQIGQSFHAYGRNTPLRHTCVFGGVNQNPQVRAIRQGVDILVATPGRLLDLMNQGFIDLRAVEVFVLDEADRMLDMGFIHDIRKIVAKLPSTAHRQTLLFSATMPGDIRALASTLLREPVSVQVAPASATADRIEQAVYFVEKRHKPQLLAHLLNKTSITRALVFTRTKHGADKVARMLTHGGIQAEAIHGNKSQNARTRALENFRKGKTPVLIASDIAARGIDIDEISHVINYDMPNVPETYVHRIGRTARAGASGAAISFCDHEERSYLKDIERLTRVPLAVREDHPAYTKTLEPREHHASRPHGPARPPQQRETHATHTTHASHAPKPHAPQAHAPQKHAPQKHAPKAHPASAGQGAHPGQGAGHRHAAGAGQGAGHSASGRSSFRSHRKPKRRW